MQKPFQSCRIGESIRRSGGSPRPNAHAPVDGLCSCYVACHRFLQTTVLQLSLQAEIAALLLRHHYGSGQGQAPPTQQEYSGYRIMAGESLEA